MEDAVDGAGIPGDNSVWARVLDFKEVPFRLLTKTDWKPVLWGGWDRAEDILVLEARALVKGLIRIALSVFGSDIKQLLLVDNMSVCLAFERCRARSFMLLVQI